MKKILTLTTVTILTFGFIGQAADDEDNRFKVDVNVTCKDENTKAAVESYIKRELRALRDVDIVTKFDKTSLINSLLNKDATYFLDIVVVKRIVGYSIAYCYYRRIAPPPRLDHISGQVRDYLRGVELLAVSPPILGIETGPTDSLKTMCERIVVNFDTGLLEFIRERRRRQPPQLDDLPNTDFD